MTDESVIIDEVSSDTATPVSDDSSADKRKRKTARERLDEAREFEDKKKREWQESAERRKKLENKVKAEERKQRTKALIDLGAAISSIYKGVDVSDIDKDKLVAFIMEQDKRGDFCSKYLGLGYTQNENGEKIYFKK
jgi:hypothetical protein